MSHAFPVGHLHVGPGQPAFIIAEAGVNHNGDVQLARDLVDAAWKAGASAVKFQTFKAEQLVTADAPKASYALETTDNQESFLDMLRRLELDEAAHRELLERSGERELVFMSTPFDEESADFLNALPVPIFKIPSPEITNIPLLRHVARMGKPVILSTGMATLAEVETAVETLEREGTRDLIILHCVSNYPARPEDTNLRVLETLRAAFGYPVGLSDHTAGVEISVAAVALGACVIEKHYTLDRNLPGPDHQASLEPDELKLLVHSIRNVEAAMGTGRKAPVAREANTAAVARKSLVTAQALPAGTVLTEAMIAIRRPGTGLPPAMREQLVGRTLRVDLPAGALLTLDHIQ